MGLIGATKPKEYCLDLLRFHEWRCEKVREAIRGLERPKWSEHLEGSFGSLNALANHLAWAEMVWLNRVNGLEAPPRLDLEGEAVFEAWKQVTEDWLRALEAKRNEDFQQTFDFVNSQGGSYRNNLFEIVVHLVDHGSYHVGQAMNAVRAFGHAPGSTNYIHYLRAKA